MPTRYLSPPHFRPHTYTKMKIEYSPAPHWDYERITSNSVASLQHCSLLERGVLKVSQLQLPRDRDRCSQIYSVTSLVQCTFTWFELSLYYVILRQRAQWFCLRFNQEGIRLNVTKVPFKTQVTTPVIWHDHMTMSTPSETHGFVFGNNQTFIIFMAESSSFVKISMI